MIDGKNVFDQPVKNNEITCKNIRKITSGEGDDYAYFRDNYKIIAIDLSKQQALDADPRAIYHINFTANLDRANNTRIFFILEEGKEPVLDVSQETVKAF